MHPPAVRKYGGLFNAFRRIPESDAIPYIGFLFCAALYLLPFMRLWMPAEDQGTLLYGGVRVAAGQLPSRDFFEAMGPGTFWWLALFLKLFGTNWFATRVCLMLTSVATAGVMYVLARRLQMKFPAVPAVVFFATAFGPLWPAISHHGDSNLFALMSFAVFVYWLQRSRAILIALAGLLAGCTTLFMQQKGILLFLSFLLLLWLARRKRPQFLPSVAWLSSAYGAVLAAVVFVYWKMGGLADLFYSNLVWPFTQYSRVNAVPYGTGLLSYYFNRWLPSLSFSLSPTAGFFLAGILIVPFLVVVALPGLLVIWALRNRSTALDPTRLSYWIAGVALWLSEFHRRDITHLVYGSPLLLILAWSLYREAANRLVRRGLHVVSSCAFFLAAFNACLVTTATARTDTPRGAVYRFQRDPVLEYLLAHIHQGDEMFVYPYTPMYYFLTGATNPTRFSILMYHINTDAQYREVVSNLDWKKVRYVVWNSVLGEDKVHESFPAYRHPKQEDLILEPYLSRVYDVKWTCGHVRLLERKPDAEAASVGQTAPQVAADDSETTVAIRKIKR